MLSLFVVRQGAGPVRPLLSVLALAALGSAARADSPFATSVVSYTSGSGAAPFTDPAAALGSPTRYTGTQYGFPGSVTPFNPSFDPGETVTLGLGGSLVVAFDHPVTNDPANPYGFDLLVFGNSFFWDPITFSPTAKALSAEGGVISVSQDGSTWFTVSNSSADGLWPTLGYADETNAFGGDAGQLLTDFTKPVDPAFTWLDKSAAEIIAGYNGSGGGAGIDIGALGLDWIRYVRVTSDTPGATPDIDAFSDVSPVPTPATALPLAGIVALRRRRR